ncbi:filamentous hemagglutinin family protein [Duganella sp. 1224]|uniref:YDG domain-containing protein n=1 Tax=Duganella sp. 1224 TaxID=2587052 RepID=UPI0015CE4346|nr:YDG domain-containing protein [Duganella sp. 1224]NYE58932.1 filamentous hemagglutinin family protein [Duganella sp. 1224]
MQAYRPYNLRRKALAVLVAACYAGAHAAPVNPTVVAGQATFNQQGKTFTITNTPNAIINWQGFSIGADEITRFIQQSSDSKVLNRVIGQDPSQILGSLQSNGKVFLINPNGVLFGAGARVDVNGLVASSLTISNADFLAGKNNFTAGDVAGKVANQGTITTPSGGQIFLIAPAVENSGIISAPNGDVVLAAGHSVQLFDSRDPNVQVVVSSPADQALNLGSIVAQGGRVGVYGALVNQRGAINANSAVRGENGKIVLKASGTTLVEAGSTTTATGSNLNTGGDILLLGQQVGVTGNALVDASGAAGGGSVLVGGDYQGKNAAVMNAQQAYVGKDALLRADATDSGNGGKVVVWSDQATQMLGAISARGGAQGGHGGQVETSGHYLDMRGTVDTRAPKGANGSLLLDPSDVYIADSLSTATGFGMLCCNTLTSNGGLFLESGHVQDSLLLTGVLQSALATTDVTVSTANSNGIGSGNINVISPLLWTGNHALNLHADGDIALKASISGIGGALNMISGGAIVQTTSPIDGLAVTSLTALSAGSITLQNSGNAISGLTTLTSNGGDIKLQGTSYTLGNTVAAGGLTLDASGTINASGNVSVGGTFKLQSGSWVQNAASLPGFSAGDFQLSGGSFLRAVGGTGTLQSPYQLADIYGLQGVASQLLSSAYVLANDIDASASAAWSGGFVPIASGSAYTGTFDGAGHLISGLNISRAGVDNVGMFSAVSTGTISNLRLSGLTVTGHSNVGGLAGSVSNAAASISGVTVSGDVEGVGNVGALVGNNAGVISNAVSAGTVTGDGGYNASNIGGLVGVNTGAISLSSSSAAVRGGGQGYTGGLVGSNTKNGSAIGSVTTSFASGAVYSSGEIVGGLIGDNNGGTLSNSYATGNVDGGRNVGGLVGRNTNGSTISNAYASGNVSGNTDDYSVSHANIGGLAGDLFDGSISNVYSTGTVSGSGFYHVYGLVGSVESGTLSNGYFAQTTATWSDAAGGIGLTAAQMQQQSSYDGFGFGSAWRIYSGHTTPLLKAFLTPVTVNVSGGDSVTKVYDGQSAAFSGSASGVPQSGVNGTLGFDGAVNAGTYAVGGLWSTQYDISYTGSSAQLTITPRTVTATVSATKTYDGVAYLEAPANYTFSNLVTGDTLGVRGSVSFNDKNVGTNKPLTVVDAVLTNNDYGNYVLSGGVSGSGSITPAALLISGLSANSRTYDGTTVATLSGTPIISAFGSDVVTLGGSGTASFSNKNVGEGKLVTLSGFTLSGADAGNYVLPTLSADITPAQLSITGLSAASRVYNLDYDAISGTYGRKATVTGGTLQGVIGNDQVSITGASGLFADKNVGTGKTVTVSGLTLGGADAGNYVLAAAPSLSADITPATLTLTLAGKQYNNSTAGSFANATLGGVLSGAEGISDAVSLVSEGATATYADKNVGVAKLVTVGGTPLSLGGADAGNYVIAANITGDITARPLSTWIGTGPGLWSAASNWADGIAPDGANVLAASLGSSAGLITYDASAGNTTLATLTSSGAPLTLTGGKLTLTGKGDLASNVYGTLTQNGGALAVQGRLYASNAALISGALSGASGSEIVIGGLSQSGGIIDSNGAVTIGNGGNIALGNIRAQSLTLNAGEGGSITQNSGGQLVADSVSATAMHDIALTNANNHVGAFAAVVAGQGDIALTNTVSSGELALGVLNTQGSVIIDNHGGIHTAGSITGDRSVSITAHSPVTINDTVSGGDITLSASTDITLNGGSQLLAVNSIGLTAGTNIQLGGVLTVQPGGSINAVATSGSISTLGGTLINSSGAAVSLSAPNGSISTVGGSIAGGTALTVNDGAAAAAAAAAAKAAADAAAAKAAADAAAAKAAADAAAKAAADAAAKAAADAAAAKAAADAAAAKAAADAAAKAAADAAAQAAADAAAKAAADAAAKAAADAAAKAAADAAAAKAAADAAAAAAAQGQSGQPVAQAINSTVNIINSSNAGSQASGSTASGGNSAPDNKTPEDKRAATSNTDLASAKEQTKKMYCN